jgi:hypothetical protein
MDSELGEAELFPDIVENHEEAHEIVIEEDNNEEETEFIIQLQEGPPKLIPIVFPINLEATVGESEMGTFPQSEEMETEFVIDIVDEEPTENQENRLKSPAKNLEEKDSKIFKYCSRICEICDYEFIDFSDLKKHCKELHKFNGFLRCCNRKFFKKFSLFEHILSHENPRIQVKPKKTEKKKSFECKSCHQMFLYRKHLKIHSCQEADEKNVFICCFCNNFFSTKLALDNHIDQEHLNSDLICPVCTLQLQNKRCLKKHLKLHKNTKTLIQK